MPAGQMQSALLGDIGAIGAAALSVQFQQQDIAGIRARIAGSLAQTIQINEEGGTSGNAGAMLAALGGAAGAVTAAAVSSAVSAEAAQRVAGAATQGLSEEAVMGLAGMHLMENGMTKGVLLGLARRMAGNDDVAVKAALYAGGAGAAAFAATDMLRRIAAGLGSGDISADVDAIRNKLGGAGQNSSVKNILNRIASSSENGLEHGIGGGSDPGSTAGLLRRQQQQALPGTSASTSAPSQGAPTGLGQQAGASAPDVDSSGSEGSSTSTPGSAGGGSDPGSQGVPGLQDIPMVGGDGSAGAGGEGAADGGGDAGGEIPEVPQIDPNIGDTPLADEGEGGGEGGEGSEGEGSEGADADRGSGEGDKGSKAGELNRGKNAAGSAAGAEGAGAKGGGGKAAAALAAAEALKKGDPMVATTKFLMQLSIKSIFAIPTPAALAAYIYIHLHLMGLALSFISPVKVAPLGLDEKIIVSLVLLADIVILVPFGMMVFFLINEMKPLLDGETNWGDVVAWWNVLNIFNPGQILYKIIYTAFKA